jgi:hypothetical protein
VRIFFLRLFKTSINDGCRGSVLPLVCRCRAAVGGNATAMPRWGNRTAPRRARVESRGLPRDADGVHFSSQPCRHHATPDWGFWKGTALGYNAPRLLGSRPPPTQYRSCANPGRFSRARVCVASAAVRFCSRKQSVSSLPPVSPWPCLVPKKFCKIFQIPRHIESLDTCIKY